MAFKAVKVGCKEGGCKLLCVVGRRRNHGKEDLN